MGTGLPGTGSRGTIKLKGLTGKLTRTETSLREPLTGRALITDHEVTGELNDKRDNGLS